MALLLCTGMYFRIIILTFFLALFWVRPVFAVTLTTSNIPSSISDQPFNINVSISGAGAGTNYLRVDLYQNNTTNYFGETYNGTSWYGSSTGTQYFPITIVSGTTWNGTVQGRLGSPSSTDYPGPGAYKIKIRRYTSSGNAASDTQTPQDITITYVSPTPTPSPTLTPTPSPSSTSSTTTSSFTTSNVPSTIDSDQIFSPTINLSLPSNPNTKFYLKGAFKKSNSDNYFGLTKVNSNWIKNSSSFSDQYQITTDSAGNWSGNLDIQIDAFDSGYEGSGDYIFKVARYSSSGSGPTWSNENQIKINVKEVTDTGEGIGVINLSKVSPSPSSQVLAVSTQPEKSEKPYSLENYQKVTTESAVPISAKDLKVQSEKQINPFIIVGIILISAGLGYLVYIYLRFRLKS